MTDRHLAASGSNTSGYDTWAKAATSTTTGMTDAITASAAGDDFYADAALTISNAAGATWTFKGTAASPNRLFSCSTITHDAPLTADLGRGFTHTNTGTVQQTITGFVYIWGVNFNIATTGTVNFNLCNNLNSEITFDDCQINFPGGATAGTIVVSGGSGLIARVTLINTPIKFTGTTASQINLSDCTFIWKNTPNAIPTGSQAAIANLFVTSTNRPCLVLCEGVDFVGGVGIASGKNLVGTCANGSYFQFINCKIASGVLFVRPTAPGTIIDLIDCGSGATNYHTQRITYQGDLNDDTTVYNTATDGTTPISWKIVTQSTARPQSPFECIAIVRKVAAGTYASSYVDVTSATGSLTTTDVWVEVQYLGANYALSSFATSFGAGGSAPIPQIPSGTTPGALNTGGSAWVAPLGGSPVNYRLLIPSFTTAVDGEVAFIVKFGKASLTAYVDPNPTIA